MFHKWLSVLLLLAGVTHPTGLAFADRAVSEPKGMSVNIEASPDDFTFIDSRMTETATAAVLFGIIGAGINSSINADEDRIKAKPFLSTANAIELEDILKSSIKGVLEKRGYLFEEEHVTNLSLEVKSWGISRTSFEKTDFAPFLVIDVELAEGRKVHWEERMKESATDTYELQDMTPDVFDKEMRALAVKTGKRIAYEILYP